MRVASLDPCGMTPRLVALRKTVRPQVRGWRRFYVEAGIASSPDSRPLAPHGAASGIFGSLRRTRA